MRRMRCTSIPVQDCKLRLNVWANLQQQIEVIVSKFAAKWYKKSEN